MTDNSAQRLIVFARRPFPGTTKSRLAADLGEEAAAGIYARLLYTYLADLLDCAPREIDVELSLYSAEDVPFFVDAFPEFIVSHQAGGDLGVRMSTAFERAFEAGAEHVVLTGSDIPGMGSDVVLEAFDALKQTPIVICPSEDGGYTLIGMQAPGAPIFEGIAWSTESVLAETEAIVARLGLPLVWLQTMFDVDTGDDFERWRRELLRVK